MTRIDTITLRQMLPRVFKEEVIPASEVWLSELTLERGGLYRIEASSGGGKSSLCAYIYGSRRDYDGTLLFNGRDASGLGMADWQELRRRHLAYLPQELDLFPELSAIDNIRLKNSLTGHVDDAKIEEWLGRLGLSARRDFPVGRMSIGQQQRVAIIRSVCQPFDFILLDEPVSHLDAANNATAAAIIAEEAGRQGAGVIATSVGNPLSLPGLHPVRL